MFQQILSYNDFLDKISKSSGVYHHSSGEATRVETNNFLILCYPRPKIRHGFKFLKVEKYKTIMAISFARLYGCDNFINMLEDDWTQLSIDIENNILLLQNTKIAINY